MVLLWLAYERWNEAQEWVRPMTFWPVTGTKHTLKVLEGPQTDNILPPLTLVPVCGMNQC